jgi:hypothetical protein
MGSGRPFGGRPLGRTGLHLVVAGNPPLAVDVDSRAVQEVRVPGLGRGTATYVIRVGRVAVLVEIAEWPCATCAANGRAFVIRRGEPTADPLGGASDAAAARGGNRVWILAYNEQSRCTLRQVGLDGATVRAPHDVPCGTMRGPETAGLVLTRGKEELLLEPTSGRTLLRARQILATKNHVAVTTGRGLSLIVRDLRADDKRQQLRWPSVLPYAGAGAGHPHAPLIALTFDHPSAPGPRQLFDVWLLNTGSRRFTHVPQMPVAVDLKFTTMQWTEDGRVVILTRTGGRDALVVWRPGELDIRSAYLRLPGRQPTTVGMAAL